MKFFVFVTLFLFFGCFPSALLLSPKRPKQIIPVDPRYTIELEMDFEATLLTVKVQVQTTGYVGFGISPDGVMWGADIFVGGVHPNGTDYSGDYHGLPGELVEDAVSNWELIAATENGTHSELSFRRLFDTGDSINDVPITDEDTYIVWSIGQTDRIVYHGPNRGNCPINFYDP